MRQLAGYRSPKPGADTEMKDARFGFRASDYQKEN